MADLPLWTGGGVSETLGANLATTDGTLVVVGGTNTKGAWTELGTTGFAYTGVLVELSFVAQSFFRVDIGVGAAGAEQIVAADLPWNFRSQGTKQLWLPIEIPAGTRVAARAQSQGGGTQSIAVQVTGIAGHPLGAAPYRLATRYGIDASFPSRPIHLDPGGTAHTKGPWVEVVASTTHPIRLAYLYIETAQGSSTARHMVDLAVGPTGSEQAVIANILTGHGGFGIFAPGYFGPFPIAIPAGSRLAARAQSSSTDSGNRTMQVAVIGVS